MRVAHKDCKSPIPFLPSLIMEYNLKGFTLAVPYASYTRRYQCVYYTSFSIVAYSLLCGCIADDTAQDQQIEN